MLKSPFGNGDWAEKSAKKTLNEKLASVLLDCPAKEEDLPPKNDEQETAEGKHKIAFYYNERFFFISVV